MCLFKNGVPRVQSVPFSALHFWNLSDWYPHSCWWNPLRSQLTYPRKALSAMEKQTFEWFDPREFSISETAHLWFPSEIPWNPFFFSRWNVSFSAFQSFLLVNFMGVPSNNSKASVCVSFSASWRLHETPIFHGFLKEHMLFCRFSKKNPPQVCGEMFLSTSVEFGDCSMDFPPRKARSMWRTARATWNGAGVAPRVHGAS